MSDTAHQVTLCECCTMQPALKLRFCSFAYSPIFFLELHSELVDKISVGTKSTVVQFAQERHIRRHRPLVAWSPIACSHCCHTSQCRRAGSVHTTDAHADASTLAACRSCCISAEAVCNSKPIGSHSQVPLVETEHIDQSGSQERLSQSRSSRS